MSSSKPQNGSASEESDYDVEIQVPETLSCMGSDQVFRVGRLLGEGSTSKCYEITDKESGKAYACKIVPMAHIELASQEISILGSLSHKHIVSLVNSFSDDKNIYIVLELCGDVTLLELVTRSGRLPENEARRYIRQIMLGCRYLHRKNIIHHDLKLNNIFLRDRSFVKIGDFAIATKGIEYFMNLRGTPNYLAPEMLLKKRHSSKVDIWALGCIFYSMLVGKAPFEADAPSKKETYKKIIRHEFQIPGEISENAKNLIRSLLAFDPSDRPAIDEALKSPFFGPSILPFPIAQAKEKKDLVYYEVQEILAERFDAEGNIEYKIKWKNYDETHNSWEPKSQCDCPEVIAKYQKKIKGKANADGVSRKRKHYAQNHRNREEVTERHEYDDYNKFVYW